MNMDWESWLRGEEFPPLKQEDPNKNSGAPLAELLGLPVVLPEETAENRSPAASAGEPLQVSQTGGSVDVEVSDADGTMSSLPQATEIQGESSGQQDVMFPVVSEVVEKTETRRHVPASVSEGEPQETKVSEATEEGSSSDTENTDQTALPETERHDDDFVSSRKA
ncbi:MAG TPA: hypothetical protein PK442_07255, partial [Synergistales bacterium]|nr:hypothetical protein [Synergistales bacterium]